MQFQLERISQLVKIGSARTTLPREFQLERISQLVKIGAVPSVRGSGFQLERISQLVKIRNIGCGKAGDVPARTHIPIS